MIFVFDLDGTICFQGKPLSPIIINALDELTHQGHEIIFASARPIRDLLPILPEHMHGYPMVGGNGTMVAKEKNIISTVHFEEDIRNDLLTIIHNYNLQYLIDSDWDYSYTGREDHPIRRNVDPEKRAHQVPLESLHKIIKMVLFDVSDHRLVLESLSALPLVIHKHGDEGIFDISPQGIDKWDGLMRLGLKEQSYIAFGNDANDISMFQHAHTSIMIGMHEELKGYATEQLQPDDQHIAQRLLAFCNQPFSLI
ncbi:HAD-IIB family hydrolase [Paenibacillus faecalis]|uniref:HAD-IIB family hydrolase n=1 Tax=Paenibacillus faecalis TaxID=2079532 RepID=UPI000D10B9EF|nr:HAD-IIB family hydrolase [Paenibacillus faecalis]